MAHLDFMEFPDLIKYYTPIGNGTLLKEECNTIENHTLLKDMSYLIYLTQPYFLEDTPNQIPTHVEYTNIVVKINFILT